MPKKVDPMPKADLTDPRHFRTAVANVRNLYNATPVPRQRAGEQWYQNVHDSIQRGIRGTSLDTKAGSGLVAAASPSMDWDAHNFDVLGEMKKLKPEHWNAIVNSHQQQMASPPGQRHRTDAAADVLRGMSISRAPDGNLVKAHRILQGEDPDVVLNRNTAPKTNSFMHNLAEPEQAGHVTIDGRAHDIATNRMQGWASDRGISSAQLKTGKSSRYEDFENVYRGAAQAIGEQRGRPILPHQVQGATWLGGKGIEMSGTTKAGTPRKVGQRRMGQPYL
jgi:hypothetical protein